MMSKYQNNLFYLIMIMIEKIPIIYLKFRTLIDIFLSGIKFC